MKTESFLLVFFYNNYTIAFIWGYVIWGLISDIVVNKVMENIREKTKTSKQEQRKLSRNIKELSPELDSAIRKPFKWAPRQIGRLERILYTTAIIFNQFALIGVWFVFKAIGEWKDNYPSRDYFEKAFSKKEIETGTTRIRANNFLIGSAWSLIFGIIGGFIFRYILDPNFIINLINNSYMSVK